jgi:hypothetical protein
MWIFNFIHSIINTFKPHQFCATKKLRVQTATKKCKKYFSEWIRARKHQQKESSARKERTALSVGVNHGLWQLTKWGGELPSLHMKIFLAIFFPQRNGHTLFSVLHDRCNWYEQGCEIWCTDHMHWAEGSRRVSIRVHACDVSVDWIWNLK